MRELLPGASLSRSPEVRRELIRAADEDGTSIGAAKAAGIYPADYELEPCAVDRELAEGDRVAVGDLALECIETPGHARGHLSFLLDAGRHGAACSPATSSSTAARSCCRTPTTAGSTRSCASLRKLRGLGVDALSPGPLRRSRSTDGQRHIERANAVLDTLLVPPQAVRGW